MGLLLIGGRCLEVIFVSKVQYGISKWWSLFGGGRYLRFDWVLLNSSIDRKWFYVTGNFRLTTRKSYVKLIRRTHFSGKTSQETLDDEDDEEEDDNNSSNNETSDSDEAMQVQFNDGWLMVPNRCSRSVLCCNSWSLCPKNQLSVPPNVFITCASKKGLETLA